MQVDLEWFHEMSWGDWEVFAEKDSTTSSTPHLNCRGDCDIDRYSNFHQMQTLSAQESLTQLEIALRPLKENLVRSCITYSKHGGIGELQSHNIIQCGDSKRIIKNTIEPRLGT